MLSKLFKLDRDDLWKGLYVAIVTVVLGSLQQMVSAHGIDFASYDWASILDVAWKAGGAYLMKNLLTDGNGNPLGIASLPKSK
jgi:hypothetical protein